MEPRIAGRLTLAAPARALAALRARPADEWVGLAAAATTPAGVVALRRALDDDAECAALAIEVARSRAAAPAKFGPHAAGLWADREAVEQASSLACARHKASRLLAEGPAETWVDLGCGVGGDALGAIAAGATRVVGFDRDPLRAACFRANTGGWAARIDLDHRLPRLEGQAVHVDPARRRGGRRILRGLEGLAPGPATLRAIAREARAAAIKLGPGDDPGGWPFEADAEWISESGRLVQLIAWTGAARRGERCATGLGGPRPYQVSSPPDAIPTLDALPTASADAWVHEPDPALERSGLVALQGPRAGLRLIHPGLGLWTGGAADPAPGFRPHRLIATCGPAEKAIARALRAAGLSCGGVKVRGRAIPDANALERRLRTLEGAPATVWVLREGSRRFAWLTASAPDGSPVG